jgi:hypothetical protein
MKTKYYCAEFRTDFPDDLVRNGDEVVQFGGQNVAEAVKELITGLGYDVKGPENGDEHGWWLYINPEDRQLWVQVTDLPPDVILMTEDITFFMNRWFSKNGHLYREFAGKLRTALEADPRFHHVRWFEEDKHGRELDPDGNPIPIAQLQAEARARKAELSAENGD